MTFCLNCATELTERDHLGTSRLTCPACGFVLYHDPKVAVAVLAGGGGEVRLARRHPPPGASPWAAPGGRSFGLRGWRRGWGYAGIKFNQRKHQGHKYHGPGASYTNRGREPRGAG